MQPLSGDGSPAGAAVSPLADGDAPAASAPRQPVFSFGRPRDWLIGAALLVALVLAVQYWVGWRTLLSPWRGLGAGELLGLLALTLLSYLLRAVRVHDYFYPVGAGRFATLLRLTSLHNVANNLLPMRAGEMVFPWLMRRYFGQDFGRALAVLIWIRLLDFHFLGLVMCLILYLRQPWAGWPLVGLAWLLLLPLLAQISRLAPAKRRHLATRLAAGLALAAPTSVPLVARLYLWTALSWSVKFLAFALLLQHFLPLDLWRLLIGVLGAELSSVLPFHGVAGSGSYELAAVASLVPFGVAPAAALAGAVNLHLFLLVTTLLMGLLALLLPVRRLPQSSAGPELAQR